MPLRLGIRVYAYTTCIHAIEARIEVFAYTTCIVIALSFRLWSGVFAYTTMHCISYSYVGWTELWLTKYRTLEAW
ncbi:hypothetical protein KY285_004905 [Solanum tuberosum]|nr:hypothetical protein KY285_004905 [Solanum tuberosum]